MDANKIRYQKIKTLLTSIKQNWNEKEVEEMYKLYHPLVVRILRKLNGIYNNTLPIKDIQDNGLSFFSELIWEYDMESPVNFTRYLKRKLYYRMKNYYEKEISRNTVSFNPDMGAESDDKSLAYVDKKSYWPIIYSELKEKELDLLLCVDLLELRQREISKIFNTFQSGIARIKRRIYKKLMDIQVECI